MTNFDDNIIDNCVNNVLQDMLYVIYNKKLDEDIHDYIFDNFVYANRDDQNNRKLIQINKPRDIQLNSSVSNNEIASNSVHIARYLINLVETKTDNITLDFNYSIAKDIKKHLISLNKLLLKKKKRKKDCSLGGSKKGKLIGIMKAACKFLENNPSAKPAEVWEYFDKFTSYDQYEIDGFNVFVDGDYIEEQIESERGNKIYQISGRISKNQFMYNYVKIAREKIIKKK